MSWLSTLTIIFILSFNNIAQALTLKDLPAGTSAPDQNISINAAIDGTFNAITYVISSTGATSGIRYRTSAVTVTVAGQTAVIDISKLVGHAPAGTHLYSEITITRADILNAIPAAYRDQADLALNDPEKVIIGAHIQIYNASTGAVLATITNKDDVASVAGAIGFGSQDISDMESRFNSGEITVQQQTTTDKSGLRPSVLVK